jgi:hypothetical protein
MKTSTLILLAIFPIVFHSSAFAQGSLTPPGAPAPTMKSLDQIESRTLISALPYNITTSGSYRLASNLSVNGTGVTISANGVTLDLNGFTISSTASSATGAAITIGSVLSDITIRNGHIRGSVTESFGNYSGGGFSDGISSSGLPPANAIVSHVTVSGCLNNGIALGVSNSTLVESCVVATVGSTGIAAHTVTASSAVDCGFTAISGDQISDSAGQSVNGTGINGMEVNNCYGVCTASATNSSHIGINSSIVSNSYGSGNGFGITAITALNCVSSGPLTATSAAENCSGSGTSGITANTALNCYGTATTGTGISAHVAMNCEGSASGAGTGVNADTVESCYGHNSGTGQGVIASSVANSYGSAAGSGNGVTARSANNCYGSASGSGIGLIADTATGCEGIAVTGYGITADNANSCRGVSSSNSGMFGGLYGIAINCHGIGGGNGAGIVAPITIASYGQNNDSAAAAIASSQATNCLGQNTGGGPAIGGQSAYNCYSEQGLITTVYKYFCGSGPNTYP